MDYNELRSWCLEAEVGDYLAEYDGSDDDGSRCGYGDDELAQVEAWLAARDLRLVADDCGLVVEAQ